MFINMVFWEFHEPERDHLRPPTDKQKIHYRAVVELKEQLYDDFIWVTLVTIGFSEFPSPHNEHGENFSHLRDGDKPKF